MEIIPTDDQMDALFAALSSPVRRRMIDVLKARPGLSVGALAAHFDVSRVAVMKHLAALEAADLVVSEREGRTRRLWFNAAPIQMIHDRWTTEFSAHWAGTLTAIKYRAEAREREKDAEKPARRKGRET